MRAVIPILTVGFLLLLTVSATPAQAGSGAGKVFDTSFDVLILRPTGFVATAVGAVLFVPAALLALPNGRAGVDQARERFITVPVESTFSRELGDW